MRAKARTRFDRDPCARALEDRRFAPKRIKPRKGKGAYRRIKADERKHDDA